MTKPPDATSSGLKHRGLRVCGVLVLDVDEQVSEAVLCERMYHAILAFMRRRHDPEAQREKRDGPSRKR